MKGRVLTKEQLLNDPTVTELDVWETALSRLNLAEEHVKQLSLEVQGLRQEVARLNRRLQGSELAK